MKNILCSVSTKGRYDTTLPICISAILNQNLLPDKIVLFDDNEDPIDLREKEVYRNLFSIMEIKKVQWEVIFGEKKGQHYNHDKANRMGYKWVWRVDDDNIPEPNVLRMLVTCAISNKNVGGVGGSIITPWWSNKEEDKKKASGKIEDIYDVPINKQWFSIDDEEEVDHLHCSFLYRAGVANYNLKLSKVAHREETMFTYELKKRGYKNIIVPNCITWHLKSPDGGIRDGIKEMYYHDDVIFAKYMDAGFLVVLQNGIGDHIVFESILNDIIKKYGKVTVACCYPEVFEGYKNIDVVPIDKASEICNLEPYNIYKNLSDWNWNDSLQNAFRKLYL